MKLSLYLALYLAALCFAEHLWKGFDHSWQRKIAGFEVPHRLGDFASLINTTSTSSVGTCSMEPGVDGDYANPLLFYSEVDNVHSITWLSHEWDDNSVVFANQPQAQTSFTIKFDTPEGTVPLLNGFSLDLHCNDNLQPDGKKCNSNGIWPYLLNIRIQDENSLLIEINRGYTPSNGGGKPYDTVMSYEVQIPIIFLIAETQDTFKIEASKKLHEEDTKTIALNVHSDELVGIQGFGFELGPSGKFKGPKGRYIEKVVFFVKDCTANMNVHVPETTHNEDCNTWMNIVKYTTKMNSHTRTALPCNTLTKSGTCPICYSSKFKKSADPFTCKIRHLTDQTTCSFTL